MITIVVPLAAIRHEPNQRGALVTELLYGESVEIVDTNREWVFLRNETDSYEGWAEVSGVGETVEATHIVSSLGSFVFTRADLKSPVVECLPFLSRVAVAKQNGDYLHIPGGWLHQATLAPIGETIATDPVEVARRFRGAPYKWGGRSPQGLDCSALAQLSHAACGIALPRDTGPQREFLKEEKPLEALAAGDLIFTPGHVMLATGPDTVIHANAHFMRVTEEKLEDVLKRYPLGEREQPVVKRSPTVSS